MNYTAKQIARGRIMSLFKQATCVHKNNGELAKSYLLTAKKIGMTARIRLPEPCRRRICKKCNTLLVPGESSRIRIKSHREPHAVITCLKCGNQIRVPLRAKNKEKNIN